MLRATHGPNRDYEVEIDALCLARQLKNKHLVKFIAGFEVGEHHYLMFQWVDGGNLRRFWERPPWSRNESIPWAVKQMKGIAECLEMLHGFNPDMNCRHGDLKPENILVSKDKILQIADMGSAKIHMAPTNLRQIGIMSLAGTIRYQPPEMETNISGKRSRAYDVWSMGCIILEFIIWVLYGPDGLREFDNSFDTMSQPFFYVDEERGPLRPNVTEWINHLRKTCLSGSDNECVSRAMRDLLEFACNQILIENDKVENGNMGQISKGRGVPNILLSRATTRVKQGKQQQRAIMSDVSVMLKRICSNKEPDYFYNEKAPITDTLTQR